METKKTLIECENLTYRYDGSAACAVDGVSFGVSEGDFLCIVGENGSGKSTLVKLMVGLLKPSGGICRVDASVKNRIGYLPQQTQIQRDFPASVMEVALSGRLNRKGILPFYGRADRAAARSYLEKLGALSLARKPYRDLSGGQQQRVLLARALCASGGLLVLDEPVTGLDPPAQADMYRIIGDLNREGIAVVMVSHDAPGAVRAAGKILHMDGSVLFFGSAADYQSSAYGKAFLAAGRPKQETVLKPEKEKGGARV
jgi:zinc transport system ATP-binding protein